MLGMTERVARAVMQDALKDYPRFAGRASSLHLHGLSDGSFGVEVHDEHIPQPIIVCTRNEASLVFACLNMIHHVLIRIV